MGMECHKVMPPSWMMNVIEGVKISCRGENDELLFVVSALKNGGLVLGMLVFNKSSLS